MDVAHRGRVLHVCQTRRYNAQIRSLSNRVERLQKENGNLRRRVGQLQKGTDVHKAKFTARLRGSVTRINYLLEQRDRVGPRRAHATHVRC